MTTTLARSFRTFSFVVLAGQISGSRGFFPRCTPYRHMVLIICLAGHAFGRHFLIACAFAIRFTITPRQE